MKKKNEKNTQNNKNQPQQMVLTAGKKLDLNVSTVKLWAFLGKSIAEIEIILQKNETQKPSKRTKYKAKSRKIKTLNQIFAEKPELKAAFDRGRLLKALADLAESNLAISEIEAELRKNKFLNQNDDLKKIFESDIEVCDLFNQSRHKHIVDVQKVLKENLHKASPAAIRAYKTLFTNEIAVPAAGLTHVSSKNMQDMTNRSRQTIENDWPKKCGLSRNADGTFNLFVFVPWFEEYILRTNKTSKIVEPEALRNKKAEMLDIELKEKLGQLLDRQSVISGLIGREQLDKNMDDKLIEKLPPLLENQPIERIRKILEDSFIEKRNEKIKFKIELNLNDKAQAIYEELKKEI